jgi:hypothetical protein
MTYSYGITNGFIVACNLVEPTKIPLIMFFYKELHLIKSQTDHYEPENWKFKSNFQINDIQYDTINNIFYACGITKQS